MWLVYACHGLNVTTIEGLGDREYGYHPIQTVLFTYNGTQCGYCSPAMIMNVYSLLEANDGKITMEQVENLFGGNICRCTGYRPILDAFKSLTIDTPIDDIEDEATTSCCRRRKQNAYYRHVSMNCGNSSIRIFEESTEIIRLPFSDGKIWFRVENLQQLFYLLDATIQNDSYILVSGDTAHGNFIESMCINYKIVFVPKLIENKIIFLGVYRRSHDIKYFIDVNGVADLHKWSSRRNRLTIGANISISETIDILMKMSIDKIEYSYCKDIAKHLELVATVAVRNVNV